MKETRYFLFYYTYTHQASQSMGGGTLWGEFTKFPSSKFLKAKVMESLPSDTQVVIASWQQFATEDDYLAFIGD